MLEFGMCPQSALDAPRFCIGPGHTGCSGDVSVEEGIDAKSIEALRSMGHDIVGPVCGFDRALFGRGQIIRLEGTKADGRKVFAAGSDPRADGCAMGY